jgi:hypothetical protein
MKKLNILGAFIALAALLTGCAQTDYDSIPADQLMGDSLTATCTIAQLKTKYMINTALFTVDSIVSDTDVVFKGIVTSSDDDGNVYKYLVVQEEGANAQAMKISINAGSLSAIYPVGQRVWIRCNGLRIGKYAQSPQLGIYYYNTDKSRVEPGRIPLPIAVKAIHAYGLPDISRIKVDTMTIAQIKAAGDIVFNKLVCIKNAFFTGKGADYGLPVTIGDDALIFAPSTFGVGYPQSREIQDGTGSIFIATSEYAKFAGTKLPASSNRGNITSIVGWYNDKNLTVNPSVSTPEIYHQLTIRSLKDLGKGFEQFHAEIGN